MAKKRGPYWTDISPTRATDQLRNQETPLTTPTDLAPAIDRIIAVSKACQRAEQQNRPAPPVLDVEAGGVITRYVELKVDGEFVDVGTKMVLPDTLELSTLAGLVDFLAADTEGDLASRVLIHIESPTKVSITAALNSDEQRPEFARASVVDLAGAIIGHQRGQESFMIDTLSRFRDGGDMESLRLQAGTIQGDKVTVHVDDGVSQQVQASVGTRLGNVTLKPLVMLNPIRSFPEIDIGLCRFVFRAQGGAERPTLALHEADAGQWAATASEKIHAYLTKALADRGIKVAGIIR